MTSAQIATVSVHTLNEKLKASEMPWTYVDVRTPDEFQSGHVPGALNLPLDTLPDRLGEWPQGSTVAVGCQAGRRSARAVTLLRERGIENVLEVEGGYDAWSAAGLPVERPRRSIPIQRQVMIVAGSGVFLGTVLGIWVHAGFLAIPLFFGGGLAFAGASGFCGMGILLEKMPWNRLN